MNGDLFDMSEEESGDIVICNTADMPSPFATGNVYTTCAFCGVKIYHRYHAPAKAKKVCIACGLAEIEKNPEEAKLMVTQETLDEISIEGLGGGKGKANGGAH